MLHYIEKASGIQFHLDGMPSGGACRTSVRGMARQPILGAADPVEVARQFVSSAPHIRSLGATYPGRSFKAKEKKEKRPQDGAPVELPPSRKKASN